MNKEFRTLEDIKPCEVDEFLEHFNIKRCVTIEQLEKLILKRKYDIIYHDSKGWHNPTPNNLESLGLKVSKKGVIYFCSKSALFVFYIKDGRVLERKLKHWVSLERGTFGYMKGMSMYFQFFKSKGFGGIDKGLSFDKNLIVSYKNNIISLP